MFFDLITEPTSVPSCYEKVIKANFQGYYMHYSMFRHTPHVHDPPKDRLFPPVQTAFLSFHTKTKLTIPCTQSFNFGITTELERQEIPLQRSLDLQYRTSDLDHIKLFNIHEASENDMIWSSNEDRLFQISTRLARYYQTNPSCFWYWIGNVQFPPYQYSSDSE